MASNEKRFDELCAKAGLRYSRAVHAVMTALSTVETPLTTSDVHRIARRRGHRLSLKTAYHLLKALVAGGAVERYDFGDGVSRYALRTEFARGHIIDVTDSTVITFTDMELSAQVSKVAESLGYRLIRYRLVIYGKVKSRPR
ncbi:MAG: transcriptional repressor [Proteobacteria bacterium]|nr:transcriptional repressor [Pseudomonadota bacterium]